MEIKKCQFCGEDIKIHAIKCKHCNEWLDDAHHKISSVKKFSGKTSAAKFVILSLATFGLYPLLWSYDQWWLLKRENKSSIFPAARAFFAVLWVYFLATDLRKFLKENGITATYPSGLIALSFFVLTACARFPDVYGFIGIFAFIPYLPLVETMNQYYEKVDAKKPEATLVWWQIILVCFGLTLLMFALYGTVHPD